MSGSSEPLHSTYAGDAEFGDLIGLFVDEMPERIEALSSACASGNTKQVAMLAHQLKGAGGGYGFPQITVAGEALERAAREADLSVEAEAAALKASVDALIDLCQRASAG